MKKAFYDNLNKKKISICNNIELNLESKVRIKQILQNKIRAEQNDHNINNLNLRQSRKNLNTTSFRTHSTKKRIRPSIPYKIVPGGAIVAIKK